MENLLKHLFYYAKKNTYTPFDIDKEFKKYIKKQKNKK